MQLRRLPLFKYKHSSPTVTRGCDMSHSPNLYSSYNTRMQVQIRERVVSQLKVLTTCYLRFHKLSSNPCIPFVLCCASLVTYTCFTCNQFIRIFVVRPFIQLHVISFRKCLSFYQSHATNITFSANKRNNETLITMGCIQR